MPATTTAPARQPSTHRRALITWLAVYPAITVTLGGLGPHIGRFPLLVRTLILTGIVVPVAVYVLVPALLRLNAAVVRAARRGSVSPCADRRPAPPAPGRG
jgi:antibiotic biosynthesis monooxygenase (ABM) superfamily enzyme